MPSSIVNIRKLKEFAIHRLPKNSVLRDILISEEDELGINIFLSAVICVVKVKQISEG
jgi:hypothetical protein